MDEKVDFGHRKASKVKIVFFILTSKKFYTYQKMNFWQILSFALIQKIFC